MSETFGDGRVNGFAPTGERIELVSDLEAAQLGTLVQGRERQSKERRGAAIFLSCLAAGLLLVFGWANGTLMDWYYQPKAEAAIEEVVGACSTGNRYLYAQKQVDADAAMRELSTDKRVELGARLQNRLRMAGCR